MTRQVVKVGAVVMATLFALVILWQFRSIVVYLLISVMLAATMRPLASHPVGKGFFARLARVVVYLLVIASIGFLLYLVGRLASIELQGMAKAVSGQDKWVLPGWLSGSMLQQVLDTRLLPPSKLFTVATYGVAQYVVPALVGVTQRIANVISGIVAIIILSLYWTVNKNNFERLWLSLLPSGQRSMAREIWLTIELDIGANIRHQLAHILLVGLLLGLGFWLLGSPYPVMLALACALVCLIPFIGVAVAVVLPVLVGLLIGNPFALVLAFYTLIVSIALGVWIEPRLYRRRWNNPILTLILLIILAGAFGLVGAIIAPIISGVCQILWSLLLNLPLSSRSPTMDVDFKQRLENIRATIEKMEEAPKPLVSSALERLSQLIEKAQPVLQPDQPANPAAMVIPDSHHPDAE